MLKNNEKPFIPTGFSETIFKDRYAFTEDETFAEACMRVAEQIAKAEVPEKVDKYKDKFYQILATNQFVPAGRIWYSSGRPSPQLLNCFVLNDDLDSKEGWGNLLRENIITSMTGGGCGQDFSDVRPRGATIRGHRGVCPGPIELMKGVNAGARMVRAGGGRRAANMFSLDVTHPDIEAFLDAKLNTDYPDNIKHLEPQITAMINGMEESDGDKILEFLKPKDLDMANISVRSKCTTSFLNAIKNNEEFEVSWKNQYHKKINAKKLWKTIVKNACDKADPGFLNMELALSESTTYYISDLVTTNPCGEIFLPSYGCCCLGHIVLPNFIKNGKIDYPKLAEVVRLGVRFLDNVLDVNNYPLPEMRERAVKERRIGLGTTGLADMMALLGVKYGSEDGNKTLDKLFRFISKTSYEESVLLAVEKGMFPSCKPALHTKSGFIKRMTPKIKALIEEHGIRNCALLTQAPTGTVSIMSNNCSSGIEPMFAFAYWRTYWDQEIQKKELVFHPLFVKFMEEGKDVSHFVSSHDLSVRDHMEVQKIVQRHVDNAVSKTINIGKDYPVSKISELWLEYLPFLKGTTFYRDGSIKGAPLKPIPIKEAIKLYNQNKKASVEAQAVNDCPKGVCEV